MKITSNIELKQYNSFGLNAKADGFIEIRTTEEAIELFDSPEFTEKKHLILGGGSNILLTRNFSGLVIKNSIKGMTYTEQGSRIILNVGAGEIWHELVLFCIDKGFAGLENLSLIPGSVGASPMQNIGAYGVEVKDLIVSVEAIEIASGKTRIFSNEECKFDYRSSIFKTELKNQYFISSVQFELSKTPEFKVSYGAIQEELSARGFNEKNLSIKAVSDAVIAIRQSKLPDPKEIGNSGSFFKNPVISAKKLEELKSKFPSIPAYPAKDNQFKVAAGWLIEQAGWKGFKEGKYGVHEKQALVLVNYGGASGQEIYDLSEKILQDIHSKFGILLEREVNII